MSKPRRWRKWLLRGTLGLGVLLCALFVLYLYFIPSVRLMGPEAFTDFYARNAQSLDHVEDPRERRLAERGKQLVLTTGCSNCHTAFNYYSNYMAGGLKYQWEGYGEVVAPNLTSDPTTGLGRRSDQEVLRLLRAGVTADGRLAEQYMMPWTGSANLTEEDRYAVLVYLRNIEPIEHRTPAWKPEAEADHQVVWGQDYGEYPEEIPDRDNQHDEGGKP